MNITLLTQGHCKHSSNSWHRYLRVQQAQGTGLLWMQFEKGREGFVESALQSTSCPAPGSASLISPNFGALKLHIVSWEFVTHNSRALPALPWQFTACTVPNATKKKRQERSKGHGYAQKQPGRVQQENETYTSQLNRFQGIH